VCSVCRGVEESALLPARVEYEYLSVVLRCATFERPDERQFPSSKMHPSGLLSANLATAAPLAKAVPRGRCDRELEAGRDFHRCWLVCDGNLRSDGGLALYLQQRFWEASHCRIFASVIANNRAKTHDSKW
jgi:hypothetical protein